MEATLKGGHAVSKCVPLADIMGLVGKVSTLPSFTAAAIRFLRALQDLSRLAAWVDYLCQTSEMLTQLTQSSFPAESHSLCAVVNLVSPYRRAPTAFQWEHNRWLPKCAESADDVVRRVMHKVRPLSRLRVPSLAVCPTRHAACRFPRSAASCRRSTASTSTSRASPTSASTTA